MEKIYFSIILFISLILISGCTTKTASNGTFGGKNISLNAIKTINVTSNHFEYNETTYYYLGGILKNDNKYDVFNIKMKATAYDANNDIVAINDTVNLEPNVLPASGTSRFYFRFHDPSNRIVRYQIDLINASVEKDYFN